MYKRLFFFLTVFATFYLANAQQLDSFNVERLDLTRKGMLALGSWAITNIALSPILASRASGHDKYFHQMNGYWNGVNLILAGFGYYSAATGNALGLSLSETLLEQHSIEKILLFNAGLDLAYVAGGFLLKERSKNATKNADRFKGFGQSLILQGGFLFAFDVAFYLIQKSHGFILFKYVDQLSFTPAGMSLIWKI